MSIFELNFEIIVLSIYFIILFFINFILESINKKRALYQKFIGFKIKLKNNNKILTLKRKLNNLNKK